MGPSSSFVEHHGFLDVFPAATFFETDSRVSCPRELRKTQLKKVNSGEPETDEFGVMESLGPASRTLADTQCGSVATTLELLTATSTATRKQSARLF